MAENGFKAWVKSLIETAKKFQLPVVDETWAEIPILDKVAILMFMEMHENRKSNFALILAVLGMIIFNVLTMFKL